MAPKSKYDPKFCQLVIDKGEEGGSLTEMATAIGISRDTFYAWREEHEAFGNAIRIALQASQAWWEEKGRQATFGGQPGFNATAFIFNMKNRFGHDYSDVSRQEISGPGGSAIPLQAIAFKILDANQDMKTIDHDPIDDD